MLWSWIFALTARLPLSWLHTLGRLLGRLLVWLPNKPRRIAALNIERCLPELDAAARQHILRESLSQFGCAALESPALWQGPEGRVKSWIVAVHGAEAVHAAHAQGHGIILFTPHIGSWEMIGLHASLNWPITHLYKAQKGQVDALIARGRSRFGARLAASDGSGVRRLLAALKAGEAIGILPDQDPPPGSGQFVPLFGIPAHTPALPAKLAARPGVQSFLCWAQRLPGAEGFAIHYEPAPAEVASSDPQQALSAINRMVESLIRRLPEQYWWGYPRFRRRPEGEPRFYPRG